MKTDPATSHFRLYVSRYALGQLQPPTPLPFSDGITDDYDPAITPDQSFIVFSSDRQPSAPNANDLFVAFATENGWAKPTRLRWAGTEARLDPDHSTLYFSGTDKCVHAVPAPHR